MNANIEDFINPKSMITPGLAATIVSTVSGAFFKMFGVALPFCLLVFSFFMSLVVFYSKEFRDPNLGISAKVFFYLLNSFIIFGMATSTHALLAERDMASPNHSFDMGSFANSAYATQPMPLAFTQTTTSSLKSRLVKQHRPFFHDWTRSRRSISPTQLPPFIKYEVKRKNYGSLKNSLVNLGLLVPTYLVKFTVDPSKVTGGIKSVTYKFPEGFSEKQLVIGEGIKDFQLIIEAWTPFVLKVVIESQTGQIIEKQIVINLQK